MRSEAIKMLPVYKAFKEEKIPTLLCSTRQHKDLLELAKSVGLIPAGKVELKEPSKEALNGAQYYPSLYVYRCVLKHDKSKDLKE